jgi:restriction system protein
MGSRRSDSSVLDDIYEILLVMPFWVGPILAAVAYAAMYWLIPYCFSSPNGDVAKTAWPILAGVARSGAPWVGGVVLFVWCFAEIRKLSNRKLFDRTVGREGIRDLKWQEFERLLAEAFRRQGYSVEHTGQAGPDGGIDLRLQKAGETKLVQCKHWRQRDIGVTILRELAGVVATERAHGGLVVSSGGFTPDAVEFAAKAKNLTLIDGDELTRMINQVQSGSYAECETTRPVKQSGPA